MTQGQFLLHLSCIVGRLAGLELGISWAHVCLDFSVFSDL